MATADRHYDRGTRQGHRWLRVVAQEFRTARMTLGISQRTVANAAKISRSAYGRIERAELLTLSLMIGARIAAVLGLDLFIALYPGPRALRDQGQADMIKELAAHIGTPLRYRADVPLPSRPESRELRAWDLVTTGAGERSAFEFETRLYDAQAQTRRTNLKRRDDPPDHFVLVVADTEHNRRVLREYAELFADLPRLRTANVIKLLRAGQHPPTGLMVLSLRPMAARSQQDDGSDNDQ